MKNYWLVSDTHFNHTQLEAWGGRSGSWQEQLLTGLRSIPSGDTLIHLGDICIGDDAHVHELINASLSRGFGDDVTTVLVRGNHDTKSMNWYTEHGWDFVCDGFHLEYMGETLLLTHRPMHPDMWRFTHNIHGHTHGNLHRAEEYHEWYSNDFHVDISPEVVGYQPVNLNSLLKKMRKQ